VVTLKHGYGFSFLEDTLKVFIREEGFNLFGFAVNTAYAKVALSSYLTITLIAFMIIVLHCTHRGVLDISTGWGLRQTHPFKAQNRGRSLDMNVCRLLYFNVSKLEDLLRLL
jgi:hypothetical protein